MDKLTPELWIILWAVATVGLLLYIVILILLKKTAIATLKGRLSAQLQAEQKRSEDLESRLKFSEETNTELKVREADLISSAASLQAMLDAEKKLHKQKEDLLANAEKNFKNMLETKYFQQKYFDDQFNWD